MTQAEQLAGFVVRASYGDLSEAAREQLKIRVLDAFGCAIGALDGEPVRLVHAQIGESGGSGRCTLIGGGRTAPDRAALYNGALVRYLDFNDSYLAPGETCHPSDNIGAVLAASEYAGGSGREFLTAVAVGARLGELLGVRWRDVDLDAGVMRIIQELDRPKGGGFAFTDPKTKHSRRSILLPQEVTDVLRAARRKQIEERLRRGLCPEGPSCRKQHCERWHETETDLRAIEWQACPRAQHRAEAYGADHGAGEGAAHPVPRPPPRSPYSVG